MNSKHSFFLKPYEYDPKVDYSGKLWEEMPIIQSRAKNVKQFELL